MITAMVGGLARATVLALFAALVVLVLVLVAGGADDGQVPCMKTASTPTEVWAIFVAWVGDLGQASLGLDWRCRELRPWVGWIAYSWTVVGAAVALGAAALAITGGLGLWAASLTRRGFRSLWDGTSRFARLRARARALPASAS